MNGRTSTVISGHQRLAILDAANKTLDYSLDVAVVDLDEKTEKEQVIFFNNESAMGRFTLDKLNALLKEVNQGHCGFDDTQLKMMSNIGFEVAPTPAPPPSTAKAPKPKPRVPDGTFAQIRKQSTARKDERYPEDKDVEFFVVVVFQSEQTKQDFQKIVGSTEQTIDGELAFSILRGAGK